MLLLSEEHRQFVGVSPALRPFSPGGLVVDLLFVE